MKTQKPLVFTQAPVRSFIKLNAFPIVKLPKCKVFKTNITKWEQLRERIGGEKIIAALFKGHIYSFDCADDLQKVFANYIKSEISEETIEKHILRRNNSIYIGMLYDLIEQHLKSNGFVRYAKNRYYLPNTQKNERGLLVYEAIELAIEYVSPQLYLCLLPTIHVSKLNGEKLPKQEYQYQINQRVSTIYNQNYNEKLKYWEGLFRKNGAVCFAYKDMTLCFQSPATSCGGVNRRKEWNELNAYSFDEPVMCFSDSDDQKSSINQLRGLVKYGPVDCSYASEEITHSPIKLALLSPKETLSDILRHLNSLNSQSRPKRDAFLPDYEGFSAIYRRELLVPSEYDTKLCITYPSAYFNTKPAREFVDFLKRGINKFATYQLDFDVLIIYIPKSFSRFRESLDISADFNLHDAIKLYATEHGVAIQFIEEHSINSYDPCKVLWGLSTSLYAKSQGVLWHPKSINEDTVYIGIGYAQSEKKGICIGCSQLFDSTGTGVRMILRKIRNPLYVGKKNPYMDKDEARKMMIALREKYYRCCPTSKIKRVVIHKTTPFMKDEIIGITQAFEGVDVELIQIQEFSSWLGVRFGDYAQADAYNFALQRGTVISLNEESFLLWTHGCVMSDELAGRNRNYYKSGRGIPSPVLVKRFYGEADADVLAREILMLTKMNWNSGDSLYKVLPVTLDLHHRMKTRYIDYREYLLFIGENNIVTCFERGAEVSPEYMWNRLEEVIGLLPYEDAYCYLTSYESDEWRDSAHHDFQYEITKMTGFWPGLKNNLNGWIKNIKYTNADKRLQKLITESIHFLSFNYTNTLEVLYGVSKNKITYIHGDASKSNELVLGHRSDDWYPEWDRTNSDEDVRLLEASKTMDRHFENTKKRIEDIILRHKDFFKTSCEYDEIYVLGLSYNDTDRMYLQEIAVNNDKAEWYFNWHSLEDLACIDHYALCLGVRSYKKINID